MPSKPNLRDALTLKKKAPSLPETSDSSPATAGSMSLGDYLRTSKRKDYGFGPEPDRFKDPFEWQEWLEDQSEAATEEWWALQTAGKI